MNLGRLWACLRKPVLAALPVVARKAPTVLAYARRAPLWAVMLTVGVLITVTAGILLVVLAIR